MFFFEFFCDFLCAGLSDIKWRFKTLPGYPDFLEECPRGIIYISHYQSIIISHTHGDLTDLRMFDSKKTNNLKPLYPLQKISPQPCLQDRHGMPPQCQEVVVGRDRSLLPAQDLLPAQNAADTWPPNPIPTIPKTSLKTREKNINK